MFYKSICPVSFSNYKKGIVGRTFNYIDWSLIMGRGGGGYKIGGGGGSREVLPLHKWGGGEF